MKRLFFAENRTLMTSAAASYGREVSFPVEVVFLLPVTILLAALSSVFDRTRRFIFVYPVLLVVFAVLIPLRVVVQNDKLRSFAIENYVQPLRRKLKVLTFNLAFSFKRKVKVGPIYRVQV